MTTNDIDAIRKLTDAADDGPWTTGEDGLVWPPHMGDPVSGSNFLPNAEFIAAARTHVPALCDEVERLRAELVDVRADLDRLTREYVEANTQLTNAWAALNRAGVQSPTDGIAELIDRLTAERDAHAIAAEQNARELDMVRTLDRQEIARLNAELAEAREQAKDSAYAASQARKAVTDLRAERDAARDMANEVRELLTGAVHALDKARAENERLREQVYAQKPVIEAAEAWAQLHEETDAVHLIRRRSAAPAVANLYDAIEQYRVTDLALTTAREEKRPADADDKPCCAYRCQDNTTGVAS